MLFHLYYLRKFCLISDDSESSQEEETQFSNDSFTLHNEEIFVDEITVSDNDDFEFANDDPIFVETDYENDMDSREWKNESDHLYSVQIDKKVTDPRDCLKVKYGKCSFKPHSKNMKINWRSTNEKNFQCNTCTRKYKYKRGLMQHMRLECSNIPQFSCEFCRKPFKYKSGMKKHVFLEHNSKFKGWFAQNYDSRLAKVPEIPESLMKSISQTEKESGNVGRETGNVQGMSHKARHLGAGNTKKKQGKTRVTRNPPVRGPGRPRKKKSNM